MDTRALEVLDFWFEGDSKARRSRWFGGDTALDASIRDRFGPRIDAARRGELSAWAESAQGALALLVLLDQMPRNVHRGTAAAFASDAQALSISEALRESGRDRELGFEERYVALLPTMHAESAAVQRRGVLAYQALLADAVAGGAPEATLDQLRSAVDYAGRHLAIIERFGRFPHRNAFLGRASTDEEAAFLKEPGSSF